MPDELQYANPDPFRLGYREGYREGFSDGFVKAGDLPGGQRDGKGDKDQKDGKDEEGEKKKDDEKEGDGDKGADDKDKDKDKDKDDDGKPPLYKRPLVVGGVLLLLLLAIIAGLLFWRHSRHHEKTDDAFIDGRASAVAAQTSGRVTRLLVTDNQQVKAGDLLLEIDSRDATAKAAQARAQLADAQSQLEAARAQVETRQASLAQAAAQARQAQAELGKAERDVQRYRQVDPDAVARQQADAANTSALSARAQLDAARSTERSARAQVGAARAQVSTALASIEAARAGLESAALQVSYAQVTASVDGRITRRTVEVGNVISVGQPLLSIVGDALWVTANFKETQLTEMRPGQAVEITVDAFPDTHFNAHVDSIQRGTGSYFSALPAENATGNYVKVVQRVPVKIVFDDNSQLRRYAIGPGMSVTPNVTLP